MADKHRYKIILLGDVNVGKTSLFNRIKTGRFHDNPSTLVEDFEKPMVVQGDQIRVSLWDTQIGGYERRRYSSTNNNHFYRNLNGALLVYSVEDSYTFENLQKWIEDASKHVPIEPFVWAVIGNKCDLPNDVEKIKVDQLCEWLQTKLFYSVSAKTGHNVMEAFQDVVTTIHNTRTHQQDPKLVDNDIHVPTIDPINNKSAGGCSCS